MSTEDYVDQLTQQAVDELARQLAAHLKDTLAGALRRKLEESLGDVKDARESLGTSLAEVRQLRADQQDRFDSTAQRISGIGESLEAFKAPVQGTLEDLAGKTDRLGQAVDTVRDEALGMAEALAEVKVAVQEAFPRVTSSLEQLAALQRSLNEEHRAQVGGLVEQLKTEVLNRVDAQFSRMADQEQVASIEAALLEALREGMASFDESFAGVRTSLHDGIQDLTASAAKMPAFLENATAKHREVMDSRLSENQARLEGLFEQTAAGMLARLDADQETAQKRAERAVSAQERLAATMDSVDKGMKQVTLAQRAIQQHFDEMAASGEAQGKANTLHTLLLAVLTAISVGLVCLVLFYI